MKKYSHTQFLTNTALSKALSCESSASPVMMMLCVNETSAQEPTVTRPTTGSTNRYTDEVEPNVGRGRRAGELTSQDSGQQVGPQDTVFTARI
eukprot:3231948-Amphidinium_carterae.1